MKRITIILVWAFATLMSHAQQSLDSLRAILEEAPVQEKVYLHIDNNCYFKGDTIWYKAYVTDAQTLEYTDQSRLLYVELVSPDGLVVERQTVVISEKGYGAGDFQISDSLYSGFYELRAYTRWMLNFCVTKHPYSRKDREQFYNKRMADDFFRLYGTVYSRVVPVYERPENEGDYFTRYIVNRAKTRADKDLRERLKVSFYPEGGHLVEGTRCMVAFEARDEEGQYVDVYGTLGDKTVETVHEGRGLFPVDVTGDLPKVRFEYEGKQYSFSLPKSEKEGCALALTHQQGAVKADITIKGMDLNKPFAAIVLCRGGLKWFDHLSLDAAGRASVTIDDAELPTGVNDLLVIDCNGNPLADRLFFIDNNEYEKARLEVTTEKIDYEPFEPINLDIKAPKGVEHLSISVRDAGAQELTFDTGNIYTELLLAGDLKGFIPHPEQYFKEGEESQRRLDLLLRVQGWRRYDYKDIAAAKTPRYTPETQLSVEGGVFHTVSFDPIRNGEMKYWPMGIFGYADGDEDIMDPNDPAYQQMTMGENMGESTDMTGTIQMESIGQELATATPMSVEDPHYGVNHGGLKHEVTVVGELVIGTQVATVELETTNGGHFAFNVPPFYGDAILFLNAHKASLDEDKARKRRLSGFTNEDEWPDYYVKRDLFFPVFAKKYDYYQCHLPEYDYENDMENGEMPLNEGERLSSMDRQLDNLEVRGKRRRGKKAIDYTQPVFVGNAYELYNLATDYGLSFGKLNFRRFPQQVCLLLFGNYSSEQPMLIEGWMNDYVFYRNYAPDDPFGLITQQMRSDYAIAKDLVLNRQKEIRLFTDFELRNEDKYLERSSMVADVTMDFVTIPDDARQPTYRDRRIIMHGVYVPDDFYHPDYSQSLPEEGRKDYRRTLYWNPNARVDEEGCFHTTFYNNGKTTRVKVDAAGIAPGGLPVCTQRGK